MICIDSTLPLNSKWQPGRHVLAVAGSAIVVIRRDVLPVVVAVARAETPLQLLARSWDLAAAYDVRTIHYAGPDAPAVRHPLRTKHVESVARGVRTLAPEIDASDADTLDAIVLGAAVAAQLPEPKPAETRIEREARTEAHRRLRLALW
jgi:hypothetical protein